MIRIVSACALAGIVLLGAQGVQPRAQTVPAQGAKEMAKQREDLMKGLWRGYYRDMAQAAKGEGDPKAVKATEAIAQLKKFGNCPGGRPYDLNLATDFSGRRTQFSIQESDESRRTGRAIEGRPDSAD